MTLFKILWSIDLIAAIIILYFFFIGIADGTVSSFNIMLWLGILAIVAAVLGGSIWLKTQGNHTAALIVSLILAIPAIVYGLFILMMLGNKGRWN